MRLTRKATFMAFFLVLTISLTMGIGFGEPFQYDRVEEVKETLPLKRGGTFSLSNVNGDITVVTWTRDEVDILAEKAVRGRKENLDRIKIEIDADADSIAIDTVFPRLPGFRGRVTYEIKVPEDIELKLIRSVNGSVRIFGPLGDVQAQTTNGSIRLEDASGQISCSTTNGDVEAMNIRGEIMARSTNGTVLLRMGSVESGISARTTNGNITLEVGFGNVDADLEARTTNGRIAVDFPVTLPSGWSSSKRRIEGKIGAGGPLISLKTTNGSVSIQK